MNPNTFPSSKWCIYSSKAYSCGARVYVYQNPDTKELCKCTFISSEEEWKEKYPWDDAKLVATGPMVPLSVYLSWPKKKEEEE